VTLAPPSDAIAQPAPYPGPVLPTRVLLAMTTLCVCAAAGVAGVWLAQTGDEAPAGWQGAIRPPGTRLPDFSLTTQDGERLTAAQLRGRPVVVTFLYSTCRDTCPAQVQSIRGALDDVGRDVPVIGVSVDPGNDTPGRARAFLLKQSMTGRMEFLLGSRAQLAPVWGAFGIAPQRDGREHSAYTVLVDAAGRQRIGFPASQLTPGRLAADLRRL
jgi:protein SCO1/2